MKYREFGKTGVQVSVVGFGGGAISGEGKGYGFGSISEAQAIKVLQASLEAGINLFDTAPIYGYGLSEKRMGLAFKGVREKVFLVSKCGITWHENQRVNLDNSPAVVRRMLEQSLKDLQTDYIDLYMVHWPDPRTDIQETMQELKKARAQGKIRFIGLSNFMPSEIRKAQEVDEIHVLQNEFNFLKDELTQTLFPFLRENRLGFMSYGTLGKGVITGTVTKDRKFDEFDARSWAPWWKEGYLKTKIAVMETIRHELAQYGYNGLELALSFNLSFPEVSTALCGIKSLEQLTGLQKALNHPVPYDLLERLKGQRGE